MHISEEREVFRVDVEGDEVLSDRAVAPVRDRVIVSSGQDWNLRALAATGGVTTGFDPGLYIDSRGD